VTSSTSSGSSTITRSDRTRSRSRASRRSTAGQAIRGRQLSTFHPSRGLWPTQCGEPSSIWPSPRRPRPPHRFAPSWDPSMLGCQGSDGIRRRRSGRRRCVGQRRRSRSRSWPSLSVCSPSGPRMAPLGSPSLRGSVPDIVSE
jgi:hypothetical protein